VHDPSVPKRSSKKPKRPNDVNALAASIVAAATAEEPEEKAEPMPDDAAHLAAVALGRRGGLKGGKARAAALTKKQRQEIAKLAADARWKKTD
jgi:Spy/CpxP family protein refolding chaperone